MDTMNSSCYSNPVQEATPVQRKGLAEGGLDPFSREAVPSTTAQADRDARDLEEFLSHTNVASEQAD